MQENNEIPNIIEHLADLIVPMVDDARSHRGKVIHQIGIPQAAIYTPHFSVDNSGTILEYPEGRVMRGQYHWIATTWGADGHKQPNSSFEPPGRRVHNNLNAFTQSVFKRLTVPWNDLIESDPEDDGTAGTRTLELVDNWIILHDDGSYSLGDTNSYVILSDRHTSAENGASVKQHFLNLLRDFQAAVYAK